MDLETDMAIQKHHALEQVKVLEQENKDYYNKIEQNKRKLSRLKQFIQTGEQTGE